MPAAEPGVPTWLRSRVARRLAAAAAAGLLLAAAPLRAQGQTASEVIGGVTVRTDSPWPSDLLPGWMPLTVELSNGRADAVEVELGYSHGWSIPGQSRSRVQLAAGESKSFPWTVPAFQPHGGDRYLTVKVPGEQRSFHVCQEDSDSSQGASHTLRVTRSGNASIGVPYVHPDQLPRDWRAYTSLSRLVLETDQDPPDREQLAAILDWVAAGGVLVTTGEPDGFELPLQERFRRDGPAVRNARHYRHGFGWITIGSARRGDAAPNWDHHDPYEAQTAYDFPAPGPLPGLLRDLDTPIPGIENIPAAALTAILLMFLLAMGPVQFSVLKKMKAPPSRLLLTTPVLGFGFAALILIFSLFSQGISVRQSVSSLTWLDQERHHASTLAKRTVFSGNVFDTNLRYGPGTAVMPLGIESGSEADYFLDLDQAVLGGGFLPVRAPVNEALTTSALARQRLAIESEGGQLSALNGLGSSLRHLWYRDENGDWFRHSGRLGDGERGELVPASAPSGRLLFQGADSPADPFATASPDSRAPALGHLPEELPPRCYVALLERSPFLDDGGIDRKTVSERHLLVGVLEERP